MHARVEFLPQAEVCAALHRWRAIPLARNDAQVVLPFQKNCGAQGVPFQKPQGLAFSAGSAISEATGLGFFCGERHFRSRSAYFASATSEIALQHLQKWCAGHPQTISEHHGIRRCEPSELARVACSAHQQSVAHLWVGSLEDWRARDSAVLWVSPQLRSTQQTCITCIRACQC